MEFGAGKKPVRHESDIWQQDAPVRDTQTIGKLNAYLALLERRSPKKGSPASIRRGELVELKLSQKDQTFRMIVDI